MGATAQRIELDRREDFRIEIVRYDPAWPVRFEFERVRLRYALGDWLKGPIEHVGSTAVPGLAAKPVIDIMAGVESLEASRGAIAAAARLGYAYFPYHAHVMHWFCKPSPQIKTYHLHLVPFDGTIWRERLAFRDYLRRHPAVARDYAMLKRQLAAQHAWDREAYIESKGPFVTHVTGLALADPA